MSMINRAIRQPIETARTAPLGASIITAGLSTTGYLIAESVNHPTASNVIVSIVSLAITHIGSNKMAQQLRLRDRVESFLETEGYDERYFGRTTDIWCGRQTVRTVLRKTQFLDDYENLCARNKGTACFRWFPHI